MASARSVSIKGVGGRRRQDLTQRGPGAEPYDPDRGQPPEAASFLSNLAYKIVTKS